MLYINREIEDNLKKLAGWFPVLFVTGPRQSGKSTLIQHAFPNYAYINLEEPAIKTPAKSDPTGFIRSLTGPTILDEAQNVPEIFSAIQTRSDEDKQNGFFVLSGSQNFLLNKNIKQSLAGRVGIAELLPLSYREINKFDKTITPKSHLLQGSYPSTYSQDMPLNLFYKYYLETYIKRDVHEILNIRNVEQFSKFIKVCATRAGCLVNYSEIAKTTGVNMLTVKSWISILQQCYIIFLVPPYYKNLNKTLTKTSKMYFYDIGLLAYLLGVDYDNYFLSEHKGKLFENYVFSEVAKKHLNNLEDLNLYFYRDANKNEVDLYDVSTKNSCFAEIKSSTTYNPKFTNSVRKVGKMLDIPTNSQQVIYAGEGKFNDKGVTVVGISEFLKSTI